MLALPVRPYPANLARQDHICTTPPPPPHSQQDSLSTSASLPPATTAAGTAAAAAMSLAIMPSSQPPAKRPKLSIQTSLLPLSLGHKSTTALTLSIATDTPTVSNTYVNAFDVPLLLEPKEPPQLTRHPTPTSPPPSSSSSTTSSSSRHTSPFPATIPYTLPMTARSILRNSPLPRRHLSATTARTPRIMFPPVKRVMFHDSLEEVIPTPVLEELPEDVSETEDPVPQREDRGDASEGDDVPSTPVQGRRKRRREWVWTLGPIEVGAPPSDRDEDVNERETPDPDHGAWGKDDRGVVSVGSGGDCDGRDDTVLISDGPGEDGDGKDDRMFVSDGPREDGDGKDDRILVLDDPGEDHDGQAGEAHETEHATSLDNGPALPGAC